MAALRHVERGTVTLTAASVTVNLATTLLDTSRALLLFSVRGSDMTDPQSGAIAGRITSTTQIEFLRTNTTGGANVEIAYTVIEWTAGVTVQRGSVAITTTTTNVTISTVTLAKAWPVISVTRTGTAWSNDDFFAARLTTTTNLELRSDAAGTTTCYWQVVEYDDCSVQEALISLASGDTSNTAAISSVDTAKSLLVVSARTAGTTPAVWAVTASFDSGTSVRITRAGSGATLTAPVYVVTFTDATSVQRGEYAFVGSDNPRDETITAITLARSFLLNAGAMQAGRGAYTTTDDQAAVAFTSVFVDADTIQLQHGGIASALPTAAWQVVQLPGSGGGTAQVDDTGAGADAATGTYVATLAESGAGSNALVAQHAAALNETGTGSDALTATAGGSLAETGTGSDTASGAVFATLAETGAGADAVSASGDGGATVPDTGAGADTSSGAYVATLTETGAGLDALAAQAAAALAESGAGADAAAATPAGAALDTGTGSDAATGAYAVTLAETGTGADAVSAGGSGTATVPDSGAGTDALAAQQGAALVETGAGADLISALYVAALAEAGVGADSITLVPPLSTATPGSASVRARVPRASITTATYAATTTATPLASASTTQRAPRAATS